MSELKVSTHIITRAELSEVLKKEARHSSIDCRDNVILVNNDNPNEIVVHHLQVEDSSNFFVGKKASVGSAKGLVAFVDDGKNDSITSSGITIMKANISSIDKQISDFIKNIK